MLTHRRVELKRGNHVALSGTNPILVYEVVLLMRRVSIMNINTVEVG